MYIGGGLLVVIIIVVVLIILLRYKINPAWLILAAGVLGFLVL